MATSKTRTESKTKLAPFDAAKYLDTDEAIAVFIGDALESGSAEVFQDAVAIAARARGMTEIAKAAGLGRESLYKALRADASPRFDTMQRVLTALGLRFTVKAA